MKRKSRLERRTPLKPSGKPMKRTRLRRIGRQKQKERKDTDGPRRDYRKLFKTCQCCERRRSRHTHEMASGGSRAQSVYHCETFLAVCAQCHSEIHETSNWPLSRQLYQKQKIDPDNYDRRLVLRIKGWDEETAITQEEVDAWSGIAKREPRATSKG